MPERFTEERVRELYETVGELRRKAVAYAEDYTGHLEQAPESSHFSICNLLHYLALRRHDLRPLQGRLSRLGLSSLGRLEAHVDATLCAVLAALARVGGFTFVRPEGFSGEEAFDSGDALLTRHAAELLGEDEGGRHTRIMVTMPSEAAENSELMQQLVAAGMNIARINCAHDGPEAWKAMVSHIRAAETATGRRCRIAFDLAGPKLRTGPLRPGPAVFRWRPQRDERGRTTAPARIVLFPHAGPDESDRAGGLPVDPVGFALLRQGGRLETRDTRERHRVLDIVSVEEDHAVATCDRTGYVEPGTTFHVTGEKSGTLTVMPFAGSPGSILLRTGDTLLIRRGDDPGEPEERGADGTVTRPAAISCDFAPLFIDCRPGEPILFDDGLIAGTIRRVDPTEIEVVIEHSAKEPARLRAEKGINVPDSKLDVPALTKKDIADLHAVAADADMISLSFVRHPEDVEALVEELDRIGAGETGIVLKIENRTAFAKLAPILLTALRHPPVAVMISRGDLGVELGFQRMAEVQEEILWLCEAAHVPVIWATQVLESLAKRGLATRAEVTDAAMSGRAECVMLNKGPHIVSAVETLDDILRRMEDHQSKKSARMRELKVAEWTAD